MVFGIYGYENGVTGCSAIVDLHPPILPGGGIDAGGGPRGISCQVAERRGMGATGDIWAIEHKYLSGVVCGGHAACLAGVGVFVRCY